MPSSPRLAQQFTGKGETFRLRLRELLTKPGLKRVRIAVSYARWEGLGLLSDNIQQFLQSGGRFEAIFGAGNGVTTPDALYYGLVLRSEFPGKTFAGYVEDEYANATFHPKFYEFRLESETVVLVGSANLTGGGLCRNSEVGIEITVERNSQEERDWDEYWKAIKALSRRVTAKSVREMSQKPGSGRERTDEVGGAKAGKPYLKQTKGAPRPLFEKVLKLSSLSKGQKDELLGDMAALTNKPKRLYLQIFERETGGSGGKPGTAVQFPVATLGSFFGIRKAEDREITIDFADQTITPRFMHLRNDTHRLRIPPILGIQRPAVMVLERVGQDHYAGRFAKNYAVTLRTKCTQQRSERSRKWGVES